MLSEAFEAAVNASMLAHARIEAFRFVLEGTRVVGPLRPPPDPALESAAVAVNATLWRESAEAHQRLLMVALMIDEPKTKAIAAGIIKELYFRSAGGVKHAIMHYLENDVRTDPESWSGGRQERFSAEIHAAFARLLRQKTAGAP